MNEHAVVYYCLECGSDCGPYRHCCTCEDNPAMKNVPHPGFECSADIACEIQSEEFWDDYTAEY